MNTAVMTILGAIGAIGVATGGLAVIVKNTIVFSRFVTFLAGLSLTLKEIQTTLAKIAVTAAQAESNAQKAVEVASKISAGTAEHLTRQDLAIAAINDKLDGLAARIELKDEMQE